MVTVPPMTDCSTTPLPFKAASVYSRNPTPFVDLKQLSSTTIELSTIIPTPRTRLLSVMTFNVNPIALMEISATKIEIGIDVPTIREAFKSPKNRKIIAIDTRTAIPIVCNTEFNEDLIISLLSSTTITSKFSSAAFNCSTTRWASSDTSTSLLLCCFLICTEIVSLPL